MIDHAKETVSNPYDFSMNNKFQPSRRDIMLIESLLSDPIFLIALGALQSPHQKQFATFDLSHSPSHSPFKGYKIRIIYKPLIESRNNMFDRYNVFGRINRPAPPSRNEQFSQKTKPEPKPSEQESTLPKRSPAEMSPYEILGLTSSATNNEIRQKYLKLAKQYHPDKNKAPDAEEYFKRIKDAYDQIKAARNIP